MSSSPNNLLNLNYYEAAQDFISYSFPIIDVHTHINDIEAARVFKRVIDCYRIDLVYSMTRFDQVAQIRQIFGEKIRFIAIPDYRSGDLLHNVSTGYIERIKLLHKEGVRIVKFWAAPRAIDLAQQAGYPGVLSLSSPHLHAVMEVVSDLGAVFMVHVADPDLWFQDRYADQKRYGSKEEQYEWLERLLDRFKNPWIAAHFGGWPENLSFLSDLLERHSNLYLDTSATKWMIRELSKHPRSDFLNFLRRWQGRIMFGSDIVTKSEDLVAERHNSPFTSAEAAVFDLYASRYWALRTFFETDFVGLSPISDPDFQLPKGNKDPAPILKARKLPVELLRSLYFEAAHNLLEPYQCEAA